jgi:hypothetical protein
LSPSRSLGGHPAAKSGTASSTTPANWAGPADRPM